MYEILATIINVGKLQVIKPAFRQKLGLCW